MLTTTFCTALLLAGQAALKTSEVPFALGERAIIVDALVNNKKVSLMFDTGFGGHVICNESVNLGKPSGKMTLRDFVGSFEVDTVKIKTLTLGSKKIDTSDAEAVMRPDEDYSSTYNTHCDGIMGFSVIKNEITEINFEKKKFIFYPPEFDITKRTPDNKRTFLARLLPTGGSSMEMRVKTPTGKYLNLALDTGNAFYATTHKDVLRRVGLWPENKEPTYMKSSFVASGAVDSWSLRVPEVEIFGVKVQNSVWDIIDLPSSSAEGDGTVGFGFLKHFNIIIDYGRRRVWLENFAGKVHDEPDAEAGITCLWDPSVKRNRVFRVVPGSSAEKAGIKLGDHLLTVNGKEVLNIGYRRMDSLLSGPEGGEVNLALSRRGEVYRAKVKLEHHINKLD